MYLGKYVKQFNFFLYVAQQYMETKQRWAYLEQGSGEKDILLQSKAYWFSARR